MMDLRNKINRVVFIILLSNKLFGQIDFTFSSSQEYNSNPFRTQFPASSYISSFDFGIEKNFSDSSNPASISYYGSYNNFSSFTDRNFYWHQIAFSKSFENSGYSIQAEQRLNKTVYTYYNYSNLSANYNYHTSFDKYYFNLAPSVNYSHYDQIPIMDNVKSTLNLSLNRGFETGTTLIFASSLNYKKYLNPVSSGSYSYLDENDSLITENFTDRNVSSIFQWNYAFRIAQSVTDFTGIAFQFTNKNILSNIGADVKELNTIYGDESEMFDDPVNSEGNNFSLELTQILFDDLQLKLGYYLNYKTYPSQGVYDLSYNYLTSKTRKDEQSVFNLNVKKDFELSSSLPELSLSLNFQTMKNISNSYMFNYKSSSIYLYLGVSL